MACVPVCPTPRSQAPRLWCESVPERNRATALTPSAVPETPARVCDSVLSGSPSTLFFFFFYTVAQWFRDLGDGDGAAPEPWGKRRQLWPPRQTSLLTEAPGLGPGFSRSPGLGVTRVAYRAGESWLQGAGAPAGFSLFGLGCPPSMLALCPDPPEPVRTCARP